MATIGPPCAAKSLILRRRGSPPSTGTVCHVLTPPAASPTTRVRSPIRKFRAVTPIPGRLPTRVVRLGFGLAGSRRSTRVTWPSEVPTNRSSPRPSRANAVISPPTGRDRRRFTSSVVDPPMRALVSFTVTNTRSLGPTAPTVMGPAFVVAKAIRRMGRPAGSAVNGADETTSGAMIRFPSWWETAEPDLDGNGTSVGKAHGEGPTAERRGCRDRRARHAR